jgi:hypothetical protein
MSLVQAPARGQGPGPHCGTDPGPAQGKGLLGGPRRLSCCQAPSTSSRLACVLPILVIGPWTRLAPEEDSEGNSAIECLRRPAQGWRPLPLRHGVPTPDRRYPAHRLTEHSPGPPTKPSEQRFRLYRGLVQHPSTALQPRPPRPSSLRIRPSPPLQGSSLTNTSPTLSVKPVQPQPLSGSRCAPR